MEVGHGAWLWQVARWAVAWARGECGGAWRGRMAIAAHGVARGGNVMGADRNGAGRAHGAWADRV